jgi:hypothetical protein
VSTPATQQDLDTIAEQLGRVPRGVRGISARCSCGTPLVVETEPRLPDGTPFPTLYYVTDDKLSSAIGTLEASGLMREMEVRLDTDAELAAAYRGAHEHYLATRTVIDDVPELHDVTAGGMPNRVKCLHVLVGHSLSAGVGVNPLGDEAVAAASVLMAQRFGSVTSGRLPCTHPASVHPTGGAE